MEDKGIEVEGNISAELGLDLQDLGLDHGGLNKNLPRMMADNLSKVPLIMDNFFKLSFH